MKSNQEEQKELIFKYDSVMIDKRNIDDLLASDIVYGAIDAVKGEPVIKISSLTKKRQSLFVDIESEVPLVGKYPHVKRSESGVIETVQFKIKPNDDVRILPITSKRKTPSQISAKRRYYLHKMIRPLFDLDSRQKTVSIPSEKQEDAKANQYLRELMTKFGYRIQLSMTL